MTAESKQQAWDEIYFNRKPKEYRLVPFRFLMEDMLIIASGSPRSGRIIPVTGTDFTVSQLTANQTVKVLTQQEIPEWFQEMARKIILFEEPRGAWKADPKNKTVTDGGLSSTKARLGALTAIISQSAQHLEEPQRWYVQGKDNNVCLPCSDRFFDKALDPVTQKDQIYDSLPSQQIIIANSTTLLTIDHHRTLMTGERGSIDGLLDPTKPLPNWITEKTVYSFMALRLGEWNLGRIQDMDIHCLVEFAEKNGQLDRLRKVPGVVDLSKGFYAQDVSVFYTPDISSADGALPIYNDYFALKEAVVKNNGRWQGYLLPATYQRQLRDELVGFSSKTAGELLKESRKVIFTPGSE